MANHKNRINWDIKLRMALVGIIADYIRGNSIYSRKELYKNAHVDQITRNFIAYASLYHKSYCKAKNWQEKYQAAKNQVAYALTTQSYEKLFKSARHGALNKKSYEVLLELEGIKLSP